MKKLMIDIETRSGADITSVGHYRYALDPEFELLLLGYRYEDTPTKVIDVKQGDEIPRSLITDLINPNVIKMAHNAAFEWWCLNRAGLETNLNHWVCTSAYARYLGYPGHLAGVGEAIGLPEDQQKMKVGKSLIDYFCKPHKPTKTNGGRRWNDPEHDPDKWELFKTYCGQDVDTEWALMEREAVFDMPAREMQLWRNDTIMNARGILVDKDLVMGALTLDEVDKSQKLEEAKKLTGLDNPKSGPQFQKYLNEKLKDNAPDNVRKETLTDLKNSDIDSDIKRAIDLKIQLSRASTSKFSTMYECLAADNRVRGISKYYGAHTGRYAGQLVQLQNMTKNKSSDVDYLINMRDMVKRADLDGLKLLYGENTGNILSQLVRTAFIADKDCKLVVADFHSIEAAVIGWLAGEEWVNEVFKGDGMIYEATAAQMFGVPKETIVKGNPNYALRQKGKVATLALGYQGGTGSLISMGALDMGIPEEDLPGIVSMWRSANPNIVKLWYDLENAVLRIMNGATSEERIRCLIIRREVDLKTSQDFLTIELPIGRKLYYVRPTLKPNRFDKPALHYWTVNTGKWTEIETYGGKLVENVVQAIARDCLCDCLLKLEALKIDVLFHVHDEIICDVPNDRDFGVKDLEELMGEPFAWAPGLKLTADGFSAPFYIKN